MFCIPSEPILEFNANGATVLISDSHARKLLWKGAKVYLAYLINQPTNKAKIDGGPIVRDYNIFPKEIISLSLESEMEFVIELQSKVAPVSEVLFNMAPAELKEQKVQL